MARARCLGHKLTLKGRHNVTQHAMDVITLHQHTPRQPALMNMHGFGVFPQSQTCMRARMAVTMDFL